MFGMLGVAVNGQIGSGKSDLLLREFICAWQAGLADALFVVSKNDVHRQWVTEALPDCTALPCLAIAHPDHPPAIDPDRPTIFTMNVEAISHKRTRHIAKRFLQSGRVAFIWDESADIKNIGSKRTKAAHWLAKFAVYRRTAAGFPNPLGLRDYYAQYKFLDWRILGLTSFGQFKDRYCVMGGFMGKAIEGYTNEDDFYQRVAPYTIHMPLPEAQETPSYMTRYVELTTQQRTLINQAAKELQIELNGKVFDTALAITRIIRVQQIACGFYPEFERVELPDGRHKMVLTKLHPIKNNRMAVLLETLQEFRGKVIIWSRFRPCIARLHKQFGEHAVGYHGGVDSKQRRTNKTRFIEDVKIKYLIGQPQSAGVGLDGLQAVSSAMVYWSNDFNALIRAQTEGRLQRTGQRHRVRVVDLIAKGTYDTRIRNVVRARRDIATDVRENIEAWRVALEQLL